MKKLYPYNKFINEGVRDQMTPKTDDDIIKSLSHLSPNDRLVQGAVEGILPLVKNAIESGADIDTGIRNTGHKWTPLFYASLNNHEEIVKYLLSKGASITTDTLKYSRGRGLYNIVKLLTTYQKKDLGISEGVRDKMTPKSKSDIDEEMEELEPLERVMAKLNQHSDDVVNKTEPYFTQTEVDSLCKEFIEIIDYSHDTYDKIDALYQYWGLSDIIEQELKQSLKILSAQEQIQCIHDMEHLGYLYTDKEWNELQLKAKKVNEGIRDKMIGKTDKYDEWRRHMTPIEDVAEELGEFLNMKTSYVENSDDEIIFLYGNTPEHQIIWDWFKNAKIRYDVSGIRNLSDRITKVELYKRTKREINEGIRDKMTGKPTEDIVKNLKNMNPVLYNKYKKDLDVDIPLESQPLIYQIHDDMKKRFPEQTTKLDLSDLGSFGQDMEFDSIIGHRNIYVSHSLIRDVVMFKIYPFKKIRKLNDLIVANNYMLENIEQYNEMIEELVKDEKPLNKIKSFFKFNESIRDKMTPKSKDDIRKAHYMIMFWKNIVDGKWTKEDKENFMNNEEFIKKKSEKLDLLTPPISDWQKELLYFLDIIYQFKNSYDEITRELVRIVYMLDRNKEQAALYIAIKNTVTRMYNEIDLNLKKNIGVGLLDDSGKEN